MPSQDCECGLPHTRLLPAKGIMQQTCKAHRRNGQPCKFWPIVGLDVCKLHGGATKKAKAKAQQARAEKKAKQMASKVLGTPIEVNPVDAVLNLIYNSAGHVRFYREQVEKIAKVDPDSLVWGTTKYSDKTGGEDWGTTTVEEAGVSVWLKLYNEERDRLAAYCDKAIRNGIEERRVRLAESQGHAVADMIRGVLGDFMNALLEEYDIPAAEVEKLWRVWAQQYVPPRLRAIAALEQ